MLNKSLLLKALLSHDDGNATHGKKEIRNTIDVVEKSVPYQEKTQFVRNRIVRRDIPRIHNTSSVKSFPQPQQALTFDPLSKFVIAFTFVIAIVAALYFVTTSLYSNSRTHLNRAKHESERIKETDSAEKTALLNTDTEKAKADLGIAQVNAAKMDQQAQSAVPPPARLLVETAQALKELERQRIEADKERLARLQAMEPIAPRQLSAQQREQLVEKLRIIPGPITFTVPRDNAEARNFAQMIAEALYDAGWTIQGVSEEPLVNIPVGLTIHSLITTPHTGLLQRSLRGVGFDVGWSTDQNVPAGAMVLLVGAKP